MLEIFLSAVKNIKRKRVRSLLTMLGIGIGVLAVVIISVIGEVGKEAINNELSGMGVDGLCISVPSTLSKSDMFNEEDLQFVQANTEVLEATPLITKVIKVKLKNKNNQAIMWGADSNAKDIMSLQLVNGRLLNKSDINASKNVCVIDETLALENYKRSNIVGKKIEVLIDNHYEEFEIIGVVSSGGNILQGIMGEVVPSFIYVPYTTATKITQKGGFTSIVAKLKDGVDEENTGENLVKMLQISKGISGMSYENINKQKDSLNEVFDIVTLVLSVIGGISLIVAGLSIMTMMLVTVNERTREIGIKKSIGAPKKIIISEFLCEALLLSLFGSIIGSMIGTAIGFLGCMIIGIPFAFDSRVIIVCIAFSMIIGVVFGVYPAFKAAALKPVDALRYD